MLQESYITFEVIQEYGAGGKDQRVTLGHTKLNLAEYVEPSDVDGEDGVTRRYLMQDSKINSTLKVTLYMRQVEGDRNFVAPPLRTAPVFGNIAGIMAGEQGEPDEPGHIPTFNTKARETGELQDLYRRTLAADLTSFDAGELRADLAIEDIFAGGDGWGNKNANQLHPDEARGTIAADNGSSDSDNRMADQSKRNLRFFRGSGKHKHHVRDRAAMGTDRSRPSSSHARGSLDQQVRQMKHEAERTRGKQQQEVDEFDVRENLRSWRLPNSQTNEVK